MMSAIRLAFFLPGASVRVRSVPVEFTNVPAGLSIASQSVDTVAVWLRGSDFVFNSVNLEALVARCDLATAHEGVNAIDLPANSFDLPLGIRVERIAPRQVTVRLTRAPPGPWRVFKKRVVRCRPSLPQRARRSEHPEGARA